MWYGNFKLPGFEKCVGLLACESLYIFIKRIQITEGNCLYWGKNAAPKQCSTWTSSSNLLMSYGVQHVANTDFGVTDKTSLFQLHLL